MVRRELPAGGRGAAVAFTIGGPQADVDACHVREIFDSFQLSS